MDSNDSCAAERLHRLLHCNEPSLDARENKFSRIAGVESRATAEIDLRDSGVKSVVDENGNESAPISEDRVRLK